MRADSIAITSVGMSASDLLQLNVRVAKPKAGCSCIRALLHLSSKVIVEKDCDQVALGAS